MERTVGATSREFSVRKILPTVFALIFGMLVVMMDSSVMNVAIPTLESAFQSGLKIMQWSITGYTLALSAVIPLAGWFSDRFGAKRVFLISIGLFMVGSLLCSIATSPAQLITFRALQGLAGGMVAPIGIAFSFRVAPPDKRGSVMGLLGLPMLISPVLGPLLSGWLLEYASWHWIFVTAQRPENIAGQASSPSIIVESSVNGMRATRWKKSNLHVKRFLNCL